RHAARARRRAGRQPASPASGRGRRPLRSRGGEPRGGAAADRRRQPPVPDRERAGGGARAGGGGGGAPGRGGAAGVRRAEGGGGGRTYGRLSVAVQQHAAARVLFHVRPGAFHPAPKVTSSVILLEPRAAPLAPVRDAELFEEVVKQAFGTRRKMLRRALEPAF